MKTFCNTRFFAFLACLLLGNFSLTGHAQTPKYQMRAVWIASVVNIDWPSRPGLDSDRQKAEIRGMLDSLRQIGCNAVVYQARPASDALYDSRIEPWSYYLVGDNETPVPYYDPLEYIISEAHKRAIEVHVWLNPYRVSMDDTTKLKPTHLFHSRRDWVVAYGGRYYLDPGRPETHDYLLDIVRDIVRRYDLDAIHLDDYFYPYPVGGKAFPDAATYEAYHRDGQTLGDWRRENVNRIVRDLQSAIHAEKPWVDFGISPFGVWRNQIDDPRGSRTQAGITNYDHLYADVLAWLREGTVDYIVPQLYWEIGKSAADYKELIAWWSARSEGRNLYVGMFASGLALGKSSAWKKGNEIARQLELNKHYPKVEGVFLYSARPLLRNPKNILHELSRNYFKTPALVPPRHGLSINRPQAPEGILRLHDSATGKTYLYLPEVHHDGGDACAYYVIYHWSDGETFSPDNSAFILDKTTDHLYEIPSHLAAKSHFGVSYVNRYRIESDIVTLP